MPPALRSALAALTAAASWLVLGVAFSWLVAWKWGGHGSIAFVFLSACLAALGALVAATSFAISATRTWSVLRRASVSWVAACSPFLVYVVLAGSTESKFLEVLAFTAAFATVVFVIAVVSAWLGEVVVGRQAHGAA